MLSLTVAAVFLFIALYVPGFILLCCCRMPLLFSLAGAPCVAIVLYTLAAVVLSGMGLAANYLLMLIPFVVLSVAAGLLRGKNNLNSFESEPSRADWLLLALSITVMMLLTIRLFVSNLDSASAFMQEHDNAKHLATTMEYVSSGDLSPFHSFYYTASEVAPYKQTNSFYPSAWNLLAALSSITLKVPVTVSMNALNVLIVSVVYPIGVFMFARVLFFDNLAARLACCFVPALLSAWPWAFLTFGPLYPNLLAMVLVLAYVSMFIEIVESLFARKALDPLPCLLMLLSLFGIAFSHPNGVFSVAVFLAPYVVYAIRRAVAAKLGLSPTRQILLSALVSVAFFGCWLVVVQLPFFRSVVGTGWPAISTKSEAFISVLTFRIGERPATYVLSALAAIGLLNLLQHGKYRWLVGVLFLLMLSYVLCCSTDGLLRSFFSGFWYNDYRRIAALVSLAFIPFVGYGLSSIAHFVCSTKSLAMAQPFVCIGICLVLTVLELMPLYGPAGAILGSSAFQFNDTYLGYCYNLETNKTFLKADEIDFAKKVKNIIPSGSLILNSPDDGSLFLYAVSGLNTFYRYYLPSGDNETPESRIIRQELYLCATDVNVQDAVERVGARYVILLDCDERVDEDKRYDSSLYNPGDWEGIDKVQYASSGFKLVLQEGDMRLYEVLV